MSSMVAADKWGEVNDVVTKRTIPVFLNYRTPFETTRAVRSLQISSPGLSPILVVDTASSDESAELLRTGLDGVQVISVTRNDGFSAGCNVGIREALRLGAARVLLLNSDIDVPAGMVTVLEGAIDTDPGLGIAGPMVVSREAPAYVQSLGISYAPWSGRMRHLGYGRRRSAIRPFERRDVDGISGCAMMIRRDTFERIGLLAEEYFFGFEDLDFCLRARASGYRSACIGTAFVLHQGNVSIGRHSGARAYFAARNHLLLSQRFRPSHSVLARAAQISAVLGMNLAHVLVTSEVPRRDGIRGFLRGVHDHFAGRYGPPTGFTNHF